MTDHHVTHATFTLERSYDAPCQRVFNAWADPATKSRWFAGSDPSHRLDFRVGGTEFASGHHDGTYMTFETLYREILDDERIVYSSVLSTDGTVATVSNTTVEFQSEGACTRLVLTEQGAYLDGHELPEWREKGTADQLDALGSVLAGPPDASH